MGMGMAYTAAARGVHAQNWNPANLGLPDNSRFSMTIVGFDAGAWNNAFNKSFYDKYNGATLSAQDVEDILNTIPDKGLALDVLTHIRVLSFSVGRFALSFGSTAASHIQIAKSFFRIPLAGLQTNEVYNFDDMDGVVHGIGYAGLSWGQPIPVNFADVFSVGATGRVYYGGAYAEVENARLSVNMGEYSFDIDGSYEGKYSLPPADSAFSLDIGWGLDIGASMQLNSRWTFGLVFSNVIGRIPFEREVEKAYGEISGNELSVLTLEDNVQDTTWTEQGEPFTVSLPPVIRVGAAFREGSFLVTADYEQGLKRGAEATIKPRFAVGTEWRGLSWFPLRMGVVMGGRVGFGTSFGFGFRPGGFVLDVGIMSRGFALPNTTKGLLAAVELGIDLRPKQSHTARVGDF